MPKHVWLGLACVAYADTLSHRLIHSGVPLTLVP